MARGNDNRKREAQRRAGSHLRPPARAPDEQWHREDVSLFPHLWSEAVLRIDSGRRGRRSSPKRRNSGRTGGHKSSGQTGDHKTMVPERAGTALIAHNRTDHEQAKRVARVPTSSSSPQHTHTQTYTALPAAARPPFHLQRTRPGKRTKKTKRRRDRWSKETLTLK